MTRVFDWLVLSRPDLDSHRFRDVIEAAIAAGEGGCVLVGIVLASCWGTRGH